jgi:hypothetical protein
MTHETLPAPQWYIYYRVDPADLARVTAQVQAFQHALRVEWPGLAATLLRRPGMQDASVTLMETYTPAAAAAPVSPTDAAAGQASLLQAIEQAAQGLSPWLRGPRRIEQFIPVT